MKKSFQFIIDFPRFALLFALALTLFFAFQLPKLQVETDVDVYLPDEHPSVKYEDLVNEIFNYQESMAAG